MITKEQKDLFRKAIGKTLEKRRLEKGMSRKELGVALGYEGNSAVQVVARFESGRAGVPKAKIEKLLEILNITNKDFGLVGSKSLKNFIAASGFLGSPVAPWGNAMVDFMEATEANLMKEALAEEETADESPADSQADMYQDVIRIMRLYRVQKTETQLSLFERLDMLDSLSEGDEDRLAEMLLTLKIDPTEAYREIEEHLMERLKKVKI
ncbi:helix-turn-helix transcriptional regulator [Geobacter sp.]|uniref:helix-turn-helix domain-containing protein n=1 Tax=Geobacter sp. TaxID=46610 RepID=UPI002619E0BF|nr:helix-turn-helix transcriptional regulator [Geobacter sp.]